MLADEIQDLADDDAVHEARKGFGSARSLRFCSSVNTTATQAIVVQYAFDLMYVAACERVVGSCDLICALKCPRRYGFTSWEPGARSPYTGVSRRR